MDYVINRIGFNRKEFVTIDRPKGTKDFVLILFKSPIIIDVENNNYKYFYKDALILYTPGSKQYYTKVNDYYVHSWCHFYPSDEQELQKLSIPFNSPIEIVSSPEIDANFQTLEREFFTQNYNWDKISSCVLKELLLRLQACILQPITQKTFEYKYQHLANFETLRLYISKHIEQAWTVKDMADQVYLSESRFSILYTEFFGISPVKDLIAMRIQKAQQLLKNSNDSVKSIGEQCGYTNEYHFIRQFKKIVGCSPRQYAKNVL